MAHAHEHVEENWTAEALAALASAGYRAGRARTAVVEMLGEAGGCLGAQDVADRLRAEQEPVGLASVYRTLNLLEELGLVHALDTGEGIARFELAHPSGAHHHHVVCTECGRIATFADDDLEHAIEGIAQRVRYAISGHEVTLRGVCERCQAAAPPAS